MKSRKAIYILFIGGILSAAIAIQTKGTPTGFPIAIFTVCCAILVAAITFPQIVIGLSSSHIVKHLGSEFYKNWKHWLFFSYQVLIAMWAIIVKHFEFDSLNPLVFYRILLFLIVFDFFYGFFYLDDIRRLIASPKDMLTAYIKRIKKIPHKESIKENKTFLSEINTIGRIARYTTMCYEKDEILEEIKNLLEFISDENFPAGPEQKNPDILDSENWKSQITPTKLQFDSWELLVRHISDSCTIQHELHSSNESNTLEALKILGKAWWQITEWKKGDFDYGVCARAIERLAYYAIQKNYNNCVEKAVAILDKIARKSISDILKRNYKVQETFISPLNIASMITDIGISAVKAGRDKLLSQFIIYLIHYFQLSDNKERLYLFYVLNLMSYVWDMNKDAAEDLSKTLDEIEEDQILDTIQYGLVYFPRETARIRRFIKAVENFSKSESSSTFLQKLVKILNKI